MSGPYREGVTTLTVTVEITAAHGSEDEERTAAFLRQLLERYDASRWEFTDRVIIDDDAIPHSHPVLTLSTRPPGRSLTGLLSMYLHEQLHWYVDEVNDPNAIAAIDACRAVFPDAPEEQSPYLHLLVCWLELASLRLLVDDADADALIGWYLDGPIYPWVYRQCIDRHDEIGAIVAAHGFETILR